MPYLSDLPAIDACLLQLHHQALFLTLRNTDKQSSTCFCSQPIHKFEVQHLLLNFYQILVNWQSVDNQVNLIYLSLSQIVRVSQYSKTSDISASIGPVFGYRLSSNQTQSGHLFLCTIESLQQFTLSSLSEYFLSFLFVSLEPLHCIDSQSRAQWFSEDNCISRLRVVGHHELVVFYYCYCTSTHHRPWIVHCLSPTDLTTRLHCCISETLDHQRSRYIFLLLVHIS